MTVSQIFNSADIDSIRAIFRQRSTTDYGDSKFIRIFGLCAPLQPACNYADMAPLGFQRAQLESFEFQFLHSASFNPNGAILTELQADLSRGVQPAGRFK